MIKLGLLNIRSNINIRYPNINIYSVSLTSKALIVNYKIIDNLDVLFLTETWLKQTITLNESTPQDYSYKYEPQLKGKGGGVAVIHSNIFSITKKSSLNFSVGA